MDMDTLNTAASALLSERLRMDVIAGNLANIHTTHDASGAANTYRRRVTNFQAVLDAQNNVKGVAVEAITEDQSALKKVYDPSHPDADEEGYVEYPNVSPEQEMVDMLSAKAAYEANIKSIQVFKSIYNSSLEI